MTDEYPELLDSYEVTSVNYQKCSQTLYVADKYVRFDLTFKSYLFLKKRKMSNN